MTWKERERAFYFGAPLAIVPALGFLPAVMFLVVVPKVAHAGIIAAVLLPALVLAGGLGVLELGFGGVQKTLIIPYALHRGVLLVLAVIAGYIGPVLPLDIARL